MTVRDHANHWWLTVDQYTREDLWELAVKLRLDCDRYYFLSLCGDGTLLEAKSVKKSKGTRKYGCKEEGCPFSLVIYDNDPHPKYPRKRTPCCFEHTCDVFRQREQTPTVVPSGANGSANVSRLFPRYFFASFIRILPNNAPTPAPQALRNFIASKNFVAEDSLVVKCQEAWPPTVMANTHTDEAAGKDQIFSYVCMRMSAWRNGDTLTRSSDDDDDENMGIAGSIATFERDADDDISMASSAVAQSVFDRMSQDGAISVPTIENMNNSGASDGVGPSGGVVPSAANLVASSDLLASLDALELEFSTIVPRNASAPPGSNFSSLSGSRASSSKQSSKSA